MRAVIRGIIYWLFIFAFTAEFAVAQFRLDGRSLRMNLIQDLVWDESRGRLIVASGTAVVLVDPQTMLVVETLVSGQYVNCLALSADQQSLYIGYSSRGLIERYRFSSKTVDLQINLSNAQGQPQAAMGIAVGPGANQIVVAQGPVSPSSGPSLFAPQATAVVSMEGSERVGSPLALAVRSLYRRPTDGGVFVFGADRVYRLALGANGPSVQASGGTTPFFAKDTPPTWNPKRVVDRAGSVFDLDTLRPMGKITLAHGCAVGIDLAEDKLLAVVTDPISGGPPRLIRYSLERFLPESEVLAAPNNDLAGACNFVSRIWTFGAKSFAIASYQNSGGGSNLLVFDLPEMTPVAQAPWPEPTVDSAGVTKLMMRSNGVAYDVRHGRIWASVPGNQAGVGNSLVGIDPTSGKILEAHFVGVEPGMLSLSADESRLYILLPAAQSIAVFDTEAKRVVRTFSPEGFSPPGARPFGGWNITSLAAVGMTGERVAVAMTPTGDTNFSAAVAVFENGVALPRVIANVAIPGAASDLLVTLSYIVPGDSAETLYATTPGQSGGGNRFLYRLRVDDQGIRSEGFLNAIKVGAAYSGGFLAYAEGRVFSGEGEIWTADLKTLLGTVMISQSYATRGIAVPLPERNRLVMVHGSPFTRQSAVTAFDAVSWRPIGTLPITGAEVPGLSRVDAVRAGSDAIAISFSDQMQIVPLARLTPWPRYNATAETVGPGIRRLRMPANGMAALEGGRRLLIATGSRAGSVGNSLIAWNAGRNGIDAQIDAGSEPAMLTVGPDQQFAWAVLQGERRVARFQLAEQRRDLVFQPAEVSPLTQYPLFSLTAAANGSAVMSFSSGLIRMYDGETARPVANCNVNGTAGGSGGFLRVALNEAGDRLYAFRGGAGESALFKRCHVGNDGLRWLSNSTTVAPFQGEASRIAGGMLFNSLGEVYDVEKSRPVANLHAQMGPAQAVLPDLAANRVFYVLNRQLMVFDWNTKSRTGLLNLPIAEGVVQPDLVMLESQQLALRTDRDEIYLVDVAAIPAAVPMPIPPQPGPPASAGVTVVPLAANDLAFDASRNLLYAAIPNSAGADGDAIVAIDPATGEVRSRMATGLNPRVLALAADQTRLFFTTGILTGGTLSSGFSPVSESIQGLDLSSGRTGPVFPNRESVFASSYVYLDIAPVSGPGARIAALDTMFQAGATALFNLGVNSLRIYDDDASRPDFLGFRSVPCLVMVAGEPGRLYCTEGSTVTRLKVDASGVGRHSQFTLLPARGAFGRMVYREGRLYTATGQVIEAETGRTLFRLNVQGAVAVDEKYVYWLDPREASRLTLRIHSRSTLEAVATIPIAVRPGGVTRLVSVGGGRVAFAAGLYIYLVQTGVE